MQGWVKLLRKLLDWEWYTDINTFKLFIHLLLIANYKPKKWREMTIDRGMVVTSLDALAVGSGLSYQETRTALNKLVSTGDITKRATNKNTIITLTNYALYQGHEESLKAVQYQIKNTQAADGQQASNNPSTTTKKDNNIKNENKRAAGDKTDAETKELAAPALAEIKDFIASENLNCNAEDFFDYYSANGWMVGHTPMQDWHAMCRKWSRREQKNTASASPDKLRSLASYNLDAIKKFAAENTEI